MKILVYENFMTKVFWDKHLKKMKFVKKRDESGKYYLRIVDDSNKGEIEKIKSFCYSRFLRVVLHDDSMERSSNYRSRFFRRNKGVFGNSEFYLCAYCGKPLSKKDVRVDHIIPVYLASKTEKYKRMLILRGIRNVNDPRNLAPSCAKCNGRKGANGGLWILRGYLGRLCFSVMLRELILLVIGAFVLYRLYGFLTDLNIYKAFETIFSFFKP